MPNKLLTAAFLASLPLLAGCGGEPTPPPRPAEEAPRAETPSPGIVTDAAELESAARRLAGLDPAGGTAPWAEHAAAMDELWQVIEARHLEPMARWAEDAFTGVDDPTLPVFYPFGGPDLPSVEQFFPEARSYVLVGLEPPGTLPRLDGVPPGELAAELERLRAGFENLAEKGYFVAKHMEADFTARHLEGFVPVLYIVLARGGHRPTAVRFVTLDDDGTPRPLEQVTPSTARAVEIEFVPHTDPANPDETPRTPPRKLYYFAQDLSDEGLSDSPGFVRFVEQLAPFNTYMKAAMYLPHLDEFSAFNRLVLDHGQSLLEEDSGIPLRDIDSERFDLTFFGTYEATLPNYRDYFQPDLRDAYQAAQPEPLPFDIGYNRRIAGSCLIWAERR